MRRLVFLLAGIALALVLASGVAWALNKVGTNGPDTLRGTNGDDNLSGEGGNDVLFGLGGSDNLVGGPGKDNVLGGNERRPQGGDKNLLGGPGNDAVLGGRGSDNAVGGSGNDLVFGERGSDRVVGGDGPDQLVDGPLWDASKDILSGEASDDVFIVNNHPARRDVVSCSSGFDRVAVDRKDVVLEDCERVRRSPAAEEELDELFEELGFGEVFEGLNITIQLTPRTVSSASPISLRSRGHHVTLLDSLRSGNRGTVVLTWPAPTQSPAPHPPWQRIGPSGCLQFVQCRGKCVLPTAWISEHAPSMFSGE